MSERYSGHGEVGGEYLLLAPRARQGETHDHQVVSAS